MSEKSSEAWQQAFTLSELSRRLQIPAKVLRIAIPNGVLRDGD